LIIKKLSPIQSIIEKQSTAINETPEVKELVRGYLSGKLFLIKTKPNETIKTIKAKYYYISKIPISQQRII